MAKPLPESIKTIGDWILAKRVAKNLTPGHVAAKMGIATSLISNWEAGIGLPSDEQLNDLKEILARG